MRVRPRAYPRGEPLKVDSLRKAPAILTNIRLGWKLSRGTNALAYFISSSMTKKKFQSRIRSFKTFWRTFTHTFLSENSFLNEKYFFCHSKRSNLQKYVIKITQKFIYRVGFWFFYISQCKVYLYWYVSGLAYVCQLFKECIQAENYVRQFRG